MNKFTYYTIIGKDLPLLKSHIENVRKYAGFDKIPIEKEILIIIYKNKKIPEYTTNSILDFCDNNGLRTHIYEEPTDLFIQNLYTCWNLGYEYSHDGYVFRAGSDQAFSKDAFLKLYEAAEKIKSFNPNEKFILQANTIENPEMLQKIGAHSRHFTFKLGNNFQEFNYPIFEYVIKEIQNLAKDKEILTIEDCLRYWGKPTALMTSLGIINRVDGCSWMMTRKNWEEYGPLKVIENNITGDVLIHDTLQINGYNEYLVRDCITYHFVRGESSDKY